MPTATTIPAPFADALRRFKYACEALENVWDRHRYADGAEFGSTYPAFMPDFGEFVASVALMELQPPALELPSYDIPEVGAVVRARKDIDRYPFFLVPKGYVGKVEKIDDEDGTISVVMARWLGDGAKEHGNRVLCSSMDGTIYFPGCVVPVDDEAWSQEDVAALFFNDHFEVIG